jgi:hypothetical protein
VNVPNGINFAGANLQNLTVETDAATPPHIFNATGWQIETLHGSLRGRRDVARAWLESIGNKQGLFVAQPWTELARVYERMGQPADAKRLRYWAANLSTQTSKWWTRIPRRAYQLLLGYGYYPLLALGWLLVLFSAASVLAASQSDSFVPSDSRIAAMKVPVDGVEQFISGRTQPAPPNYPPFSPVLFAVDTAIPPVPTGQSQSWRITGQEWLPLVFALIKAAGWALSALFIAGLTGILRKE